MPASSLPSSSGSTTLGHEKDEEANIAITEKPQEERVAESESDTDQNDESAPSPLQPSNTRAAILEVSGVTYDEQLNAYIVGWEGPDDPSNPLNWAPFRRWGMVSIVSLITLITPLASTMFAAAVPMLMEEFNVENRQLSAFVVSIFVLGFVIGPLICSPLSELHGRLPVYHASNCFFLLMNISCALAPSLPALMVFRILAGAAGSAALAIGGGTIADVIPIHHRGKAMVLFSMGPIVGPVIGPVGGGFAGQALGWRWIFWILSMCSGSVVVLCFLVMKETFAPKILGQRTKKLKKQYPHIEFRSLYYSPLTEFQYMKQSMSRPLHMLINPIVISLSLYLAVGYGYLYLLFTTFSMVFRDQYGFSFGTAGLSFLGCGIGSIIGAGFYAYYADTIHTHLSKQHGSTQPEFRLPALIMGAVLIPVGLFLYGWTVEYKIHWIVPQIGSGIFGFALVLVFQSIMNYLVDTFEIYAASSLAANMVLRSLGGALLPLGGEEMYAKLGHGWGNSLLGFVAIAIGPLSVIFYKYGDRIRAKSKPKF